MHMLYISLLKRSSYFGMYSTQGRGGGSIFECESFEIIILVLVWHLIMVVYCVKNYLPMS